VRRPSARDGRRQNGRAATSGNGNSPEKLLAESLDALEHLDRHRLEAALSEAAVSLSSPRVRQEILVPMLESIGERWREGSIRIAHEHLASAIVRSFLGGMRNGRHSNAPRIVVTTPAGQRHELGALMAAAAADESGWNVFYLGPDLPAEEIAAAVRQLGARAIGLSIVYNEGEEHVVDELRRIRSFVPDDVMMFVGGRASCTLERHLGDVDIHVIREIPAFQDRLVSIGN
jgi:methanogenic corrinoid protein MtbC1